MTRYNQAFCIFILSLFSSVVSAQDIEAPSPSTNSPYTRYGFGQLSDQSFGNGKAMGGIGYGLRNKSQINPTNPASYTAIDSLTFLLEGGFSLQNTNFSEGNLKKNVQNANFDYIAMQFRLHRRLAMSLGFLPFSNVGYKITSDSKMSFGDREINVSEIYKGTGGINQAYMGVGFKILDGLSVGANISYLFGTIEHSSTMLFTDPQSTQYNIQGSQKRNRVEINDYKLDFGLQYSQRFNKKHLVTIGGVYSLKHNLNNDASKNDEVLSYVSNGWYPTSQSSTIIDNGFELPHMFGAGLTYNYNDKLTLGFDYTLQKWGEVKFFGEEGTLRDRSKYAFGGEYIPNSLSRNYLNKIRYRLGAYYSDPYINVKGEKGAYEYGVSAGFGLPIFRSLLNISGQYIRVKPKVSGMIEENYLRVNIGLTFNERWFAKWRVQ